MTTRHVEERLADIDARADRAIAKLDEFAQEMREELLGIKASVQAIRDGVEASV